ncbi:MAG: hypothetical protein OXH31_01050 [Gammaproteobacteria bacterium]|nr:hypothetical protein [Gammaproteobacteria bacterium]
MLASDYIYVPKLVGRRVELAVLRDLKHDVKTYIKPVIGSERLLETRPPTLLF